MGEVENNMKIAVYYEFPDDFEPPPQFEDMGLCRCRICPLRQHDDDCNEWCGVTQDGDWTPENERKPCPLYNQSDDR